MPAFKDHFSTGNADYAAHRPTYPSALVDYLARVAPGRDLALDVACGSGQLTVPLAARFARVVGVDASAGQIAEASPHPGVEYRVAPAEATGLETASVDLITVAQAAHWLDLDAFYDEARRVARPGGVVALISYGVLHLAQPAVEAAVQHLYGAVLGAYWPPERRHVETGYADLPFPFTLLKTPDLAIEVSWGRDDVLGYVGTWSAMHAARRALGEAPMADFRAALEAAWPEGQGRLTVRWPLALRVGRAG
ncbi:MAG: SAM-dependent methyltransferase [Caulobacteraceae bacterium]|nr:SAM-dependent methyltransferase [Caulobacteraceae bacterium]